MALALLNNPSNIQKRNHAYLGPLVPLTDYFDYVDFLDSIDPIALRCAAVFCRAHSLASS